MSLLLPAEGPAREAAANSCQRHTHVCQPLVITGVYACSTGLLSPHAFYGQPQTGQPVGHAADITVRMDTSITADSEHGSEVYAGATKFFDSFPCSGDSHERVYSITPTLQATGPRTTSRILAWDTQRNRP